MKNITVDGVEYAPIKPNGNRAVVVVDRGWIFAGDVERKDGRIKLTRAVWVFKWESIGFDKMIAEPTSNKVTLRPMDSGIDIPEGSAIFMIPVDEKWGLK